MSRFTKCLSTQLIAGVSFHDVVALLILYDMRVKRHECVRVLGSHFSQNMCLSLGEACRTKCKLQNLDKYHTQARLQNTRGVFRQESNFLPSIQLHCHFLHQDNPVPECVKSPIQQKTQDVDMEVTHIAQTDRQNAQLAHVCFTMPQKLGRSRLTLQFFSDAFRLHRFVEQIKTKMANDAQLCLRGARTGFDA